MFEFILSAEFLTAAVVFSVAGAYVGVLLGRRSQTANAYVDRIRSEYEDRMNKLKQQIRDLQAKGE